MPKEKIDFIGHYKDFLENDNAHYPNSEEKLSIRSPIGEMLGLKKTAFHVEILPPGRRTTWPHAEKEEEEFVFVIQGHPDVWLDGELVSLNPGELIAFPAGTGIAHTFINNTEHEVVLIVGGEISKSTNKVFYPLHEERNDEVKKMGIYWENHPKRKLGLHDSLPDALRIQYAELNTNISITGQSRDLNRPADSSIE